MVIQMNEMKEYRIHRGFRIFMNITLSIGIIVGCIMILVTLISDHPFQDFMPLILVFMGIIALGIIANNKIMLVIHRNKIGYITLFSKEELLFNEINGYKIIKVSDKYFTRTKLFIESNTKNKKNISVDITFFGKADTNEIIKGLSVNHAELGCTAN